MEPDEPEIVLPKVFLEVEDVNMEDVSAELPESEGELQPDISVALPEEEKLEISDELFSVPLPSIESMQTPQEGRDFFIEGLIGAGSMNHTLGSISLYKLGTGPRFNVIFEHEGIDGYGYREAGKGFSSRRDNLEGGFSFVQNGFTWDIKGKYLEQEEGFQNIGNYESITHRFIEGNAESSIRLADRFSAKAMVDGGIVSAVLGSRDTPLNQWEFHAAPHVNGKLELENLTANLNMIYEYRQSSASDNNTERQKASATAAVKAELPYQLYFDGKAALDWEYGRTLLYPFTLALDGSYSNILSYGIEGGYTISAQNNQQLWKEYTFLSNTELKRAYGWEGNISLQWQVIRGLYLNGSFTYADKQNVLMPENEVNSDTGLFGYTYENAKSFSVTTASEYHWKNILNMGFSYTFNGLDRNVFTAPHIVNLTADVTNSEDSMGGTLEGTYKIKENLVMPEIGMSGHFRLSDGLLLIMEAKDMLSPFIVDGRSYWGPYEAPGFELTMKFQFNI